RLAGEDAARAAGCNMTRPALAALLIALLATVAEAGLSIAMFAALRPPLLLLAMLIPFLVGPLLFLALLAWRRRTHRGRSRLLLVVTVVVVVAGVAILGIDSFRVFYQPERSLLTSNPVILPLVQWGVVLVVWLGLVVQEAREKRAKRAPDKPT